MLRYLTFENLAIVSSQHQKNKKRLVINQNPASASTYSKLDDLNSKMMKHGMSAYPSLGLSIQPKEDLNSNQRVQDKLGAFDYNAYHQMHHLDHKY
jgi:hypothetical protein